MAGLRLQVGVVQLLGLQPAAHPRGQALHRPQLWQNQSEWPVFSLPCPQLYSKIRREIIAKEQAAYEGRQAAGVFKPIERAKLEVGCLIEC